jgi:hypothetical protein
MKLHVCCVYFGDVGGELTEKIRTWNELISKAAGFFLSAFKALNYMIRHPTLNGLRTR